MSFYCTETVKSLLQEKSDFLKIWLAYILKLKLKENLKLLQMNCFKIYAYLYLDKIVLETEKIT